MRRQKTDWQRSATQDLSAGNTAAALAVYDRHHRIAQVESRAQARSALIARYANDHKLDPTQSQLVMAFTCEDVKALNTDTAYVALSRHRDNATVFYATDDFGGRAPGATEQSVKARFAQTLSRARPRELAHDYRELEPDSHAAKVPSHRRPSTTRRRTLGCAPATSNCIATDPRMN